MQNLQGDEQVGPLLHDGTVQGQEVCSAEAAPAQSPAVPVIPSCVTLPVTSLPTPDSRLGLWRPPVLQTRKQRPGQVKSDLRSLGDWRVEGTRHRGGPEEGCG